MIRATALSRVFRAGLLALCLTLLPAAGGAAWAQNSNGTTQNSSNSSQTTTTTTQTTNTTTQPAQTTRVTATTERNDNSMLIWIGLIVLAVIVIVAIVAMRGRGRREA